MGMRQQFTKTSTDLLNSNPNVVVLLNDIGVFAFRFAKEKYPNRVKNLGILEQGSISVAAGLSLSGLIPIFHTIAPFIVERGYEQLKDDFGYQNINGNFVSVGASYDYSKLGTTHYCPGDIAALMQIPNMQIIVPGTEKEFDLLLKSEYNNGSPTYYRLSEFSNMNNYPVKFGKAIVIKNGKRGTVIAVGTMLDRVIESVGDLDVTILYYTTLVPFDRETLRDNTIERKILLCEPYYYGALTNEVISSFPGEKLMIDYVGVPHISLTTYGSVEEMDRELGMCSSDIKKKLVNMIEK